ncbi:NUDIX domain-containing protein [Candidatus Peregrinibacteria bacterium]|jgi:bis(5'-nucleosidyl)-tetraphosphatase|nr:NUDIX domain-containing protein [Candidatus Peregrinibacteria bacterium]MBT4148014.1 NUDIX domain-containing protein [Candidatus Peregrinibacteria bacterium]MBT4366753.1 NUDIX domain-containing protein [Candidatus Peregrinibacteria bacterium]MBT4456332.1 NUDIX domain-containing protein [Candidatus Peregrinibacteria bacterium]
MAQVDKKPDEKSCGIVLFSNTDEGRKYLILHYPSGHFDLPKGHVEKGEEDDEHRTALRELEEETGIADAKILPGFRLPIHYTYKKQGKPSFKQVVFFIAETKETEVTISFEHQDFIWLPYKEAVEKLTFDNAKNLLKRTESFVNNEIKKQ